ATWNYAAVRMPPGVAGMFLYLIPVMAVVAGAIMLDEEVGAQIIIGGSLILSGGAGAQYGGPWHKARRGQRAASSPGRRRLRGGGRAAALGGGRASRISEMRDHPFQRAGGIAPEAAFTGSAFPIAR